MHGKAHAVRRLRGGTRWRGVPEGLSGPGENGRTFAVAGAKGQADKRREQIPAASQSS